MHLFDNRVLMQIFNLLVIFADIKITVAVVRLIMEMSTSEGWRFKMSDGCLILDF